MNSHVQRNLCEYSSSLLLTLLADLAMLVFLPSCRICCCIAICGRGVDPKNRGWGPPPEIWRRWTLIVISIYVRQRFVCICVLWRCALVGPINAITAFPDKSDTAGNTQVRPIL